MIIRLMSVELLKLRRKWIWPLVALGPVGVIALQAVNYALRYDYLVHQQPGEPWDGLISAVAWLTLAALLTGIFILASMTAGIEHQLNAWKLTVALPVKKRHLYAAKFLLTALLLLTASVLLIPLTVALGLSLGFGTAIPYGQLIAAALFPYLAALPVIALQVWLSVTIHNQAVPLTVGIVGMMTANFAGSRIPDWLPYKWPQIDYAVNEPGLYVPAGIALGLVIYAAGMLDFVRKDVR
ncbi:ABC transporter permease [Paenibacillus kobensis]|uniref:ABC transporter permease n=1 Tax=Paenibacillus kobensis TaxID=59841 RepID=UPI001FE324CA|nr:ABC transporter permease [Paenibacillus kobensis]